jgi:hypothetical protein
MEISDRHVEWAVVNRLKAMLETPSQTAFNVTQSFAMFTTIVLWTKNRAWIGGKKFDPAKLKSSEDHSAHKVREGA